MALDGLEPVIIFKLYRDYKKDGITLQKWQQMSEYERDTKYPPIPIPIYLGGLLGGEQLTGIALDDADQTIDFGQTSIGGLFFQKNMGNDVTITFRARRDNPIMIILLAVISQLIALIPDQRYGITLYYDSIFVLNGLIKSITQQTVNNSNIKLVQFVISERGTDEAKTDTDTKKDPISNGEGLDNFGIKPKQ